MSHANFLKPIAILASLALLVGGVLLGREVPFSQQWPLYEALRTTAAIIFAVVGSWLAIIYPDRLKYAARSNIPTANKGSDGIGRFFTPIAHSTAILCIILIIGIVAPLARSEERRVGNAMRSAWSPGFCE